MRETAEAKGKRYVTEGRLTVTEVGGKDGTIRATCRGAGITYKLGYARGGGWRCDCPALTRCAHLVALQLVVDAT